MHPRTINSIANLGELLLAAGKNAEAEPFLREAYEKRRRVLGNNHAQTRTYADMLAELLKSEGRTAEAQAVLRERDHK